MNVFHSGGSAEELSDTESLPSTARPATSQSLSRAAGPTRAIARTQQSERVRANVNRHRISQARTSQVWHDASVLANFLTPISSLCAAMNFEYWLKKKKVLILCEM